MKIKWLGHSCFLLTSGKGTRVITDPFDSAKGLDLLYKEVTIEADIVTSSHSHSDHSYVGPVKGNPVIIREAANTTIKDIKIWTVHTWHDEHQGKERGPNLVFCFEIDGVNICHMGDTGEHLQKSHVDAIGKVDVLLMPVGGIFTLDCRPAMQSCESLKPSIIIPMHYKTQYCTWLQWTADDFIKGHNNYKKMDTDEIEVVAGKLPEATEIIIPKYKG
jgi:L-ascorbate metabolism protein UlaG (beta-lactamase superfamily)